MADRICGSVVYRLTLLVAGALAAASAAAATPGALDTGFNPLGTTPGIVSTNLGSNTDRANALVLQPDGKLVAAGTTVVNGTKEFALARYNNDGSLDGDFHFSGTPAGTVTTAFGGTTPGDSQAYALVLQPDGKLVAAGTAVATIGGVARNVFALVRYNNDGSLDGAFNAGGGQPGSLTTAFAGDAQADALALQADGKLVAAGYAFDAANNYNDVAIVRYNPDGSLDTSFNAGGASPGMLTVDMGADAHATAVVLEPVGTQRRILVAGYRVTGGNGDFVLLRFNGDGSPDTAFNAAGAQQGRVVTDLGADDRATALVLQADGRIVAAGYTENGPATSRFALARYNSDGSVDTTFNAGGTVTTVVGAAAQANAVAVQPDGRIVAGGVATPSVQSKFAVARYNSDGSLDTSFNPAGAQPGTLAEDITAGNAAAYAMVLDPAGKIVLAGNTDNNVSRFDFALGRFFAADSATPWRLNPDTFTLDDVGETAPSTDQKANLLTSNVITVAGLPTGFSVPVLVSGGEYAKNGSNAYTDLAGWAQNGDTFNVRQAASTCGTPGHPVGTCSRSVSTKLSIGGLVPANNTTVALGPAVSDTFTSTTDQGPRITGTPITSTEATSYYVFVPRANDQDSTDSAAPCGGPPGDLVFSIANKPSWARFDKACGKLDGFPGSDDLGTDKDIVISVADPEGLTASLPPFSLQVTNNSDGGTGPLGPLSLAALAGAAARVRRRRGASSH